MVSAINGSPGKSFSKSLSCLRIIGEKSVLLKFPDLREVGKCFQLFQCSHLEYGPVLFNLQLIHVNIGIIEYRIELRYTMTLTIFMKKNEISYATRRYLQKRLKSIS